MKVLLNIDNVIVDEQTAYEVFKLVSDKAEAIRKGWGTDNTWEFRDIDNSFISISPVSMANYAQAVMHREDKNKN
jgi:hypothetical protein